MSDEIGQQGSPLRALDRPNTSDAPHLTTSANTESPSRFAGRRGPLARVLDAVQRAGAYHPRVVLVLGERGVGKTRFAAEVAMRSAEQRVQVAWGRARETGAVPALWPWKEALSILAQRLPRVARRHRGVLDAIAGTNSTAAVGVDLAAAVVAFLADASARSPLLVILDDLHLADPDTLAILQYVSGDVGRSHFVILGTYRDDEVLRRSSLAAALGKLDQRTMFVQLSPFTRDEVDALLDSLMDHPAEALVDALWRRSGGNAFFLTKLIPWLQDAGPDVAAAVAIPPGVREEVIGYRLAGVSDDCRQLLQVAAVFTDCASPEVLERLLGESVWDADGRHSRVLAALDEALGVRLLRRCDRHLDAHYTFTYELIREALHEHLPLADRGTLHQAAAAALATLGRGDDAEHLEVVARQFSWIGSAEALARAAGYAAAAATVHARQGRDERAAALYERALADAERTIGSDAVHPRDRATWWLQLSAIRRRCGDLAGASAAARRAAALARTTAAQQGAADLLVSALAASQADRPWSATGRVDDKIILMLQEALRELPDGDSCIRAQALTLLAGQFYHSEFDSGGWRDAAAREAVAMARRLGDAETLAYTLRGHHNVSWFANGLDGRLRQSAELVTLARQLPDPRERAEAHLLHALDRLESGDLVEVGRQLLFSSDVSGEGGERFAWHADIIRAAVATYEGRLSEAERLAEEAVARGQQVAPDDAGIFFGVHLYTLRRLQGRFDELLPLAHAFVEQFPLLPIWRVGIADLRAQAGDRAAARAAFEYFAAGGFVEPPADWNWLLAMALLSEVCAFLGDQPRAAILYERLLPYADQNVTAVPGLACIGPAAFQLGCLATVLERWAAAADHFDAAARRNHAMGGLPYAAHAQRHHAAMLLRQWEDGHANDLATAAELVARSRQTYDRLGMATYGAAAARLADQLDAARQRGAGGAIATPANALRRDGQRWVITWNGDRAELPNLVGLRHIAYLIQCSPAAMHVSELESACVDPDSLPLPGRGREWQQEGLSVQRAPLRMPAIDARARAEYADALAAIEGELSEAEAHADLGRQAVLREQREALIATVSDAYAALGDDDRPRKRVWRTIRTIAIPAIAAKLPDLAAHLTAAIHTGSLCRYDPNPPVTWTVHFG